MDVRIKKFEVNMAVKSSGIEFEVRSPGDGKHLGDCYVTMSGLIWCKGKTGKKNGVKLSWSNFISYMESSKK